MIECGVGHVRRGPIDGVHLAAEGVKGGVCEEAWDAVAGAAPDDGGGGVVVPFGDLGEDLGARGRGAEVKGELEKALRRALRALLGLC